MTHDDSVQIAATSLARRRALARVRRGDGASGVARKRGSRCGGIGNHPPCKQRLENSQMGKESQLASRSTIF